MICQSTLQSGRAGNRSSRPIRHLQTRRNGLDNRRCNLRICTQLQNSQNSRRRRPGKSRFRGVFPRGDKWQAAVQHNGKPMYLGLFDEEVEAARARDRKAFELAGEFAVLNFPDEMPR
ncbi:MAG: hypothetical protein QM570_17405 [Planctomycetota bacterium]|nr:hypothetical protein [Planctomycetota bacterium]